MKLISYREDKTVPRLLVAEHHNITTREEQKFACIQCKQVRWSEKNHVSKALSNSRKCGLSSIPLVLLFVQVIL